MRGITRIALRLEAHRAERFEQENLAAYDGAVAVSEVDQRIFVNDYGFSPDRVKVVENSVDPKYFSFTEREPQEKPQIVFVSSLTYLPNQQAAWRLIRRIMPRVWREFPEACLWIVGQDPEPVLRAQSDGRGTVVTGKVDDVRPYLARASVACVPLTAGSGTKLKVLEALSTGVPWSVPLALEGWTSSTASICSSPSDQDLAAAIVRLVKDAGLAATLARNRRDQVERRHTWDVNLRPWRSGYQHCSFSLDVASNNPITAP
jgi:glycosyltransferase involved in cell wall biosynthesis